MSACTAEFRIDHVMIVANGTTGQNASNCIVDFGEPPDENRGGDHFRAYLKERDLEAVNAACETEGPACAYEGNGHLGTESSTSRYNCTASTL